MKGYGIVFCVSVVLLWLMPLGFQEKAASAPTVGETAQDVFSVELTADPSVTATADGFELTLYETMASVPPDAPTEAIKAQAVACYTRCRYQRDVAGAPIRTALPYPDAYSESYWRAQWGERADANLTRYREAVEAVRGQVVTFDGQPVMALSHALNTGKTESASVLLGEELPYLQSVASPADALRVDLHTTVSVPLAEAETVLKTLCGSETLPETTAWFGEAERTEAGTVKTVTVCGKVLQGRQLQEAFSLPSTAFEVQVQDGQVLFTVSGQGHFVGMSACGAAAMATDGATYDTILKHYYTGVEMKGSEK